jgi:hypothetical protein
MRRSVTVALAVLALLGVLVPPAFAQAPAPKVTIEGFLDQTTSYTNNISLYDNDVTNSHDKSWYARTRGRFQITGEVGKAKGVFLFEMDNGWGSSGGCTYGNCINNIPLGFRDGNINTEILGDVEMLWMYTEFPLTGEGSLLPFVPIAGTARLGFQPFEDTYKLGVLDFGNFGGAHVTLDLAPGIRYKMTYAGINNHLDGNQVLGGAFSSGNDFMMINSLEVSPFKGLDIMPIYAYYSADGVAAFPGGCGGAGGGACLNGQGSTTVWGDGIFTGPRQGVGGVQINRGFFPQGATENRHTIGVDAKYTMGPFTIAPTVFYQFGDRMINTSPAVGGVANDASKHNCGGVKQCVDSGVSAWFLDLTGGWTAGPLKLEGKFVYTTGNNAKEDLRAGRTIQYYRPLDTDGVFNVGWGTITAIGNEYVSVLNEIQTAICPACEPSYDKYGRIQLAVRPTYELTPAFKLWGVLTPLWTAQKVDTNASATLSTAGPAGGGNAGLNPNCVGPTCKGRDQYLGTELSFGFNWDFAPNISFMWSYGHMFTGNAMSNIDCHVGSASTAPVAGACPDGSLATIRHPKDIDATTAVVRYTF